MTVIILKFFPSGWTKKLKYCSVSFWHALAQTLDAENVTYLTPRPGRRLNFKATTRLRDIKKIDVSKPHGFFSAAVAESDPMHPSTLLQ